MKLFLASHKHVYQYLISMLIIITLLFQIVIPVLAAEEVWVSTGSMNYKSYGITNSVLLPSDKVLAAVSFSIPAYRTNDTRIDQAQELLSKLRIEVEDFFIKFNITDSSMLL